MPFPPPEDLPNPGIEPVSLVSPPLPGGFFTTGATWEVEAKLQRVEKLNNQNLGTGAPTLENNNQVGGSLRRVKTQKDKIKHWGKMPPVAGGPPAALPSLLPGTRVSSCPHPSVTSLTPVPSPDVGSSPSSRPVLYHGFILHE